MEKQAYTDSYKTNLKAVKFLNFSLPKSPVIVTPQEDSLYISYSVTLSSGPYAARIPLKV